MFASIKQRWLVVFASLSLTAMNSSTAFAANEVVQADTLRQTLGLSTYSPSITSLSGLKIAILDQGFAGYAANRGLLPASAELVAGPQNAPAPSTHGLGMAQIIWAMTGKLPEGPKFYLLNTNGFTNFKAAVDFVIQNHVDIVLYSQVWTFGSDFDGTGFINETVNRATSAGVLWINAAGNFGRMVHNGRVSALPRDLSFNNRLDDNELTVTLSWNDFEASEDYDTDKDLDLMIYDENDRLVGSSELIQRGEAPPETGTSNLSSHARESIVLSGLDRGTYRIRVRRQSGEFVDSDRFRVVINAERFESIDFTDRTSGEEIFAPADNPNVITVGEGFEISSQGPTADGRTKPDVILQNSTVSFSNGSTVRGSSTAAALFAGVVSVLKCSRPELNFSLLMNYIRSLQGTATGSEGLYPISPTGYPRPTPVITALIPSGGRLAIHPNGHYVILTPVDALELPVFRAGGAYRQRPDDIMVLQPVERRWFAYPKTQERMIVAPLVEFRLLTPSSAYWRTPSGAELAQIRGE